MGKLSFLMGHREAGIEIAPLLRAAIQDAIASGVTEFVVGHYGGFDRIAARTLSDVKQEYPGIRLTLLLPYYDSEKRIVLPDGFDDSLYPDGQERVPKRLAIVRANEYMLSVCDCAIFYAWHPASNTMKLYEKAVQTAKRRSLTVVNIGNGKPIE